MGFPAWVWLKLALVLALAAHYGWTGRMVLRARRGVFTESDRFLRIFNEISVVGRDRDPLGRGGQAVLRQMP